MSTIQLWEMIRFLVVGSLAVLTDFVLYFLLVFWGLPTSPSKGISWISGNLVSFFGHRRFVFHATHQKPQYQIVPFIFLYASTFLINNVLNEWVLHLYGIKILAWFIATAVAVSINFLGLKFVVFRRHLF